MTEEESEYEKQYKKRVEEERKRLRRKKQSNGLTPFQKFLGVLCILTPIVLALALLLSIFLFGL